jgi:hypothetical protein
MTKISEHHRIESERLHEQMFRLHRDVYGGALSRIRMALKILHELEDSADLRAQCRNYITEFEKLRTRLEELGRDAADFRTQLIRENGCDGSCSDG